jgi:hypothetical protein
MDNFYCGKGDAKGKLLGSNYKCMKKGIGVGRRVKLPLGYRAEAVDPRANLYCGTKSTPSGKLRGNRLECFRKGFGIGKKLQEGYGFDGGTDEFPTWLCSLIVGLITVGIVFAFTEWGILISIGIGVITALLCGFIIIRDK